LAYWHAHQAAAINHRPNEDTIKRVYQVWSRFSAMRWNTSKGRSVVKRVIVADL